MLLTRRLAAPRGAAAPCCWAGQHGAASSNPCPAALQQRWGTSMGPVLHAAPVHQLAVSLASRQRRQRGARRRAAPRAAAAQPPQQQPAASKARLAVFVSGGGSNMRAIHAACLDGRINADIVVRGACSWPRRASRWSTLHGMQLRQCCMHARCCLRNCAFYVRTALAHQQCNWCGPCILLRRRRHAGCATAQSVIHNVPHPPQAMLRRLLHLVRSLIHSLMHACMHPARAQVVVSDVPSCGGVQYAQSHGIPTLTFPVPKKGGFEGLSKEQLVQQLTQEAKADYVLLAGFLKVGPMCVCACAWGGGLSRRGAGDCLEGRLKESKAPTAAFSSCPTPSIPALATPPLTPPPCSSSRLRLCTATNGACSTFTLGCSPRLGATASTASVCMKQ